MAGGISELDGEAIIAFIPDRTTKTLENFLMEHLDLGSKNILHTDGYNSFYGFNWTKFGYFWKRNIHEGAPVRNSNGGYTIVPTECGLDMVPKYAFDPFFDLVPKKKKQLATSKDSSVERKHSQRTIRHSNLIEGLWGRIKYVLHHLYNGLPGTKRW